MGIGIITSNIFVCTDKYKSVSSYRKVVLNLLSCDQHRGGMQNVNLLINVRQTRNTGIGGAPLTSSMIILL